MITKPKIFLMFVYGLTSLVTYITQCNFFIIYTDPDFARTWGGRIKTGVYSTSFSSSGQDTAPSRRGHGFNPRKRHNIVFFQRLFQLILMLLLLFSTFDNILDQYFASFLSYSALFI